MSITKMRTATMPARVMSRMLTGESTRALLASVAVRLTAIASVGASASVVVVLVGGAVGGLVGGAVGALVGALVAVQLMALQEGMGRMPDASRGAEKFPPQQSKSLSMNIAPEIG